MRLLVERTITTVSQQDPRSEDDLPEVEGEGENFTHPIREELKEEDQEPEEPMTQEATTQEEWDSLSASSLEPMPEAPET